MPPIRVGRDILALLPAAALTAFWAISSTFFGGYFPSAWYPAAIIVVVLCPLLLAAGWRLPRGGTRVSLALLVAFVAWTALSIAWAGAEGHALEATNKLLLAMASAFVFAITPWNERRGFLLIGFFATAITIASLGSLISAAYGSDPASHFIQQRYSAPLGYAGASAAFPAMATWPALAISSRRTSPIWLRALMFAIVIVQVDLALLPQSRGAVIGLVVSALFFVGFSPSRGWALLRILLGGAIVLLTLAPFLHVYAVASQGGAVDGPLHHAVAASAVALAAGFAAGLVLAWLESRRPELPGTDVARRAALPALGVAVVALILAAALFGGRASSEVSSHWDSFKNGHVEESGSTSHLSSLGDPQRYDYWRVALKATGEAPLVGEGAGNFQDFYTVDRHSQKHSKYAHSIWMRVLSETGIVGLLLLLGALITGFVAVARGRRGLTTEERLLAAGAVSVTALVFTHASLDWIEEFPAILGPGLCLLFLAGRLVGTPPSGPSRRQATGLLAGVLVAGVALVALVPAYLSLRFVSRAEADWPTDPTEAYKSLDRARYLDPLSSQPDIVLGEIAVARGEEARARFAFERAIEREDGWYPHFELALIASHSGEKRNALAQMERALSLDSVDPIPQEALAALREGRRLSPIEVQNQIQAETKQRFYHVRPPGAGGG